MSVQETPQPGHGGHVAAAPATAAAATTAEHSPSEQPPTNPAPQTRQLGQRRARQSLAPRPTLHQAMLAGGLGGRFAFSACRAAGTVHFPPVYRDRWKKCIVPAFVNGFGQICAGAAGPERQVQQSAPQQRQIGGGAASAVGACGPDTGGAPTSAPPAILNWEPPAEGLVRIPGADALAPGQPCGLPRPRPG